MSELQPNDKVTLERIRGRVDDPWAPPAGHYRDDVRFLIDRIDELTAGVVAAPVEDACICGHVESEHEVDGLVEGACCVLCWQDPAAFNPASEGKWRHPFKEAE